MFEFSALDSSTIAGGALVVFVLAVLRFGDQLVDRLLSYRSSPVEAIERTIPEQD